MDTSACGIGVAQPWVVTVVAFVGNGVAQLGVVLLVIGLGNGAAHPGGCGSGIWPTL